MNLWILRLPFRLARRSLQGDHGWLERFRPAEKPPAKITRSGAAAPLPAPPPDAYGRMNETGRYHYNEMARANGLPEISPDA